MRALFTQLSFLIGLVTAIELYGRQPNLPVAILLGLSAACTMYIVLLLGDHAIHRYFEDETVSHASLTYLDSSFDPENEDRIDAEQDVEQPYEKPDAIAA